MSHEALFQQNSRGSAYRYKQFFLSYRQLYLSLFTFYLARLRQKTQNRNRSRTPSAFNHQCCFLDWSEWKAWGQTETRLSRNNTLLHKTLVLYLYVPIRPIYGYLRLFVEKLINCSVLLLHEHWKAVRIKHKTHINRSIEHMQHNTKHKNCIWSATLDSGVFLCCISLLYMTSFFTRGVSLISIKPRMWLIEVLIFSYLYSEFLFICCDNYKTTWENMLSPVKRRSQFKVAKQRMECENKTNSLQPC